MDANEFSLALQIAVGAGLLMLGRRLYWLFVAAIGFVVAMQLAGDLLELQQEWMRLALAVAAGIVGALFAIVLQRIAVAIAGFAAAAFVAREVMLSFGEVGQVGTVIVLVVGVLGAIFASALFDWALIILSSVAGAALLVDVFDLEQTAALVIMAILALAGISIQANMLHRDRGKER